MRVLILGKNGMLGHDMEKAFSKTDFVSFGQDDLDVTDQDDVFAKFMTVQPDIVINCTGYTNVDKCEEEEEIANQVNGYAVGIIAKACREIDATLVHFSTDYVFHGSKKNGYDEEDGPNPINAYGRSKALGEQLLFDEMDSLSQQNPKEGKYFLIRTSWLFGKNGDNFVDTMVRLGSNENNLKVVDDQHGKPTFTPDLCEQVKWLVESHEYPSGIYHITNEDVTTWYQFAKTIFKLANIKTTVVPCATEEFPRPAKRPKYSSLNNNMLPKLRSWKEALKVYINK